jgi:hypothetical protein
MGYDLTVQGLIRKRAELAGQVEALHMQLSSLMASLNAIDTSIRVFKPDIDLEDLPSRIPPAPLTAFRGEFQRFLLDELRKADRPLSTLELAASVMERRALDPADKIVSRLIARRTGYSLCKMRRSGLVTSRAIDRRGGLQEWLRK